MDETIGAKGAKNDRKRSLQITIFQLKKLFEYAEKEDIEKKKDKEKKKKELERIIRKNNLLTLIKISPIIIFGNLYEAFKKETPERIILREYERLKKEDQKTNAYKDSNKNNNSVVLVIKEGTTYKIIDSAYQEDKKRFLSIEERLNQKLNYKVKVESLKETKSLSEEDKKTLNELTFENIIDTYDNKVIKARKELESIINEYIKVIGKKEKITNIDNIDSIEEIDLIVEQTRIIKEELIALKEKEEKLNNGIELVDKREDTLLEETNYSVKLDTQTIFEIDENIKEVEKIEKKLEEKKEQIEEKEDEEDITQFYDKEKELEIINKNMMMFLSNQEQIIQKLQEKLSQAITYEDKLNIRFETLNESTQRTLENVRNRMHGNGPLIIRAATAMSTMAVGMTRNILFPRTVTEITQQAIVEDYSKEINSGIVDIENAIGSVNNSIEDIDSITMEIKKEYPNSIQSEQLISNLYKIRQELENKKKTLQENKQREKDLYEKNSEKLLQKNKRN